uniref:Cytochrome b-c1 complex subunit 9 n=1 Tax=Onchocerca volvulus TaxID=6282 RepID=A0A8R1TXV5_ONCVO
MDQCGPLKSASSHQTTEFHYCLLSHSGIPRCHILLLDYIMALASFGYKLITKRFSTLFVALTVGAISTDLIIDKGGDYLFNQYNKGKLWKDIKDKYVDDLAFTG